MTNLRFAVHADGAPGASVSVACIESTVPPASARLLVTDPRTLVVRLHGLALNMDPFEVAVLDGLIRAARLDRGPDGSVECRIRLDFPAQLVRPRLHQQDGLPARTLVLFGREAIRQVLRGRRIVVDPAHGGPDRGATGPINLEEQRVVLQLGRRLAEHLDEAGATPLLTRRDERALSSVERLRAAVAWEAEAMVVLHTGHDLNPGRRGVRTLYDPASPASWELARAVHLELIERLGTADLGLHPADSRAIRPHGPDRWPPVSRHRLAFPVVLAEPVCIRNPLDEALLRSCTYRDRVAQAIRNGLVRFFASGAAARALAGPPAAPDGRIAERGARRGL